MSQQLTQRHPFLNVHQTPEELHDVHGVRDYYWYLRSPEYVEAFTLPVAGEVNRLGRPCLDVGCGDGMLADHVTVPYTGFDGSEDAIRRARVRNPHADFRVGRFEDPEVDGVYPTVVFSGILEVLVRPERRVELLEAYRQKYRVKHFVVCDLLRLDTSGLDRLYRRVAYFERLSDLKGVEPVKNARKVLVYAAEEVG